MATSSKKKKTGPKRRSKKQYRMVEFELDDFDGPFVLPDIAQVPLGVQRKVTKGDMDTLAKFLEQHAAEGVLDAFDDLGEDEVQTFIDRWGSASEVTGPKSEG